MVSFRNWPFSAIAVTGLMYSGWKIAKNGWQLLNNERSSDSELPQPNWQSHDHIGKELRGHRLRWISPREFTSLLTRFSDLILIDLSDGDRWDVLPIHAPVTAFRVRRHELSEILESLPENRILVFYRLTDLDILLIGASSRAKGVAPIYILEYDAAYTDGA